MSHPPSSLYHRLYDSIARMPVIDCHEHLAGPDARPPYQEPIASLVHGYLMNDLHSAAFGIPLREVDRLADPEVSTDEKWTLFEKLWHAVEHTAYARVTKLVLQNTYGVQELTRQSLDRVAEKLAGQDEAAYFRTIDEAGIQVMLVDVLWETAGNLFVEGKKIFPKKWKLMISIPWLMQTSFNGEGLNSLRSMVDLPVTSLDEYLYGLRVAIEKCIENGAIGFKDQSAYTRVISYDLVAKYDAEKLFNRLLSDPRSSLGWPELKPLGDFLFHQIMRFAREFDLPVQIHTGHMAGVYNRVDKTNAANLASVLELHQDVRFDLFHGNWPYMGDLLFLGKNYPNVSLDLCWLHIVDPQYAIELLERGTMTLPHTKIHGFGGDYGDVPEFVAAHLQMARAHITAALVNLVERSWLCEEEALTLAANWLFNNPNRFFRLGFEDIHSFH